LLTYLEADLS